MFKKVKSIHFIGIGGIGMSGIAELLYNQGFKITGSDLKASEIVVKPLTAQNKNVIFFVSPPRTNLSGSSANCSTSAGDRYCEKAPLICFFSFASLR